MNIQKSRLAALIGLILMVCMMVAMLVVPASAAVVEQPLIEVKLPYNVDLISQIHDDFSDCQTCIPEHIAVYETVGYFDSECNFYVSESFIKEVCATCDNYNLTAYTPWTCSELNAQVYKTSIVYEIHDYEIIGDDTYVFSFGKQASISDVVTPELFNSTLDEIVALLPVVIPVMIGFIGLRKGISFLQSVLHSA